MTQLFVVIRVDRFQMEDEIDPKYVSAKRTVYGAADEAEAEAARLNTDAPEGVYYFARELTDPAARTRFKPPEPGGRRHGEQSRAPTCIGCGNPLKRHELPAVKGDPAYCDECIH